MMSVLMSQRGYRERFEIAAAGRWYEDLIQVTNIFCLFLLALNPDQSPSLARSVWRHDV